MSPVSVWGTAIRSARATRASSVSGLCATIWPSKVRNALTSPLSWASIAVASSALGLSLAGWPVAPQQPVAKAATARMDKKNLRPRIGVPYRGGRSWRRG